MKIRFIGVVLAGIMVASTAAQAATLQVLPPPGATTINAAGDAPFDLSAETGLNPNTSPIYIFNSATVGAFGLSLSDAANLTFTYLGKDASFTNTFTTTGGAFSTGAANPSFSDDYLAGFVDFVLGSSGGGTATNNGAISSPLQFAIAALSDTSVIVLFDDGGQGTDFDDMAIRVDVSQVPLPPAVWLLLSAILGLVSFTRIRRGEASIA